MDHVILNVGNIQRFKMPDPLKLLKCLEEFLNSSGGILSRDDVPVLASIMSIFNNNSVSKCIYVLILKNTAPRLLESFMHTGGWELLRKFLARGIYSMNWAVVKEILELLQMTCIYLDRLQSNNLLYFVKLLSDYKDIEDLGVQELAEQLLQLWFDIIRDEIRFVNMLRQMNPMYNKRCIITNPVLWEVLHDETTAEEEAFEMEQTSDSDDTAESEESDSDVLALSAIKFNLKNGKQLISKFPSYSSSYEIVKVTEGKDIKKKGKKKKKTQPHCRSYHKSSSAFTSSDDSSSNSAKTKSSHSRHRSSKLKDRNNHKYNKSKDSHRSSGSVRKSSSNSSKENKKNKEKQTEKDKDTLTKMQPQNIHKLPIKRKMRSAGLKQEAKPAAPRSTKKAASTTRTVRPRPRTIPTLERTSPLRDIVPEKRLTIGPPIESADSLQVIRVLHGWMFLFAH